MNAAAPAAPVKPTGLSSLAKRWPGAAICGRDQFPPDAGKTTPHRKKLLLYGGAIQAGGRGERAKGEHARSTSDWMELEKAARQISITSHRAPVRPTRQHDQPARQRPGQPRIFSRRHLPHLAVRR